MNQLIVVAHPAPQSFTMGLARTYCEALQRLGQPFRIFDLYRMGFDPVLKMSDLEKDSATALPDVAEAQRAVWAADVLTFIYPLWWMSMPAIMKGFVDRVFARGFAFESGGGMVHGLLSGRKCVLITVSGAPLSILAATGKWSALEVLQDTHVFRSTGFEVLEHLHFDCITPQLTAVAAEEHFSRVRRCAETHFAAASCTRVRR